MMEYKPMKHMLWWNSKDGWVQHSYEKIKKIEWKTQDNTLITELSLRNKDKYP